MFSTIKTTGGFANELPALRNRRFDLTGSLPVVLFGPNGCGKSTLLNILAAYSLVPRHYSGGYRGWSNIREDLGLPYDTKSINLPEDLKHRSISPASVAWDGSPTFFFNSEAGDKAIYDLGDLGDKSPDGLTEIEDLMTAKRRSSGEVRLTKLKKVKMALDNPPPLLELSYDEFHKKPILKDLYEYIKGLPRIGRPTLLLDEPDRSLSLINNLFFWGKFIPSLTPTYQVIVATHSPLVLLGQHRFNMIDVSPGYLEASNQAIRSLTATGSHFGLA